jgi:hypothetical protein
VTWLGDLKAGDGKRALYLNVAVDANANVYGADRLGNRVVIWDPTGTPASWGSRGNGPGEFDFGEVTTGDQSQSVAIAPDGRVAVGDGGNHRVQVFDTDGTFRSAIGREGTGNGEFINPCCVAFGSNGRLYVADPGRGDIQVFDQDGKFIRVIGSKGSGNGQFSRLGVPFVDPRGGNIWVPDFANRRVQVVTPGGEFVANYGTGQNGNPRLAEVNGVVLDSLGRMFIVDTSNVVYVLDRQGRLVTTFGPEIAGAGFVAAAFLALTPDGKLYLPDAKFPGGDRIVAVQLTPPLWPP